MAISQQDLDLVRNEFEAKLANARPMRPGPQGHERKNLRGERTQSLSKSVAPRSLDNMKAATAISAYGERSTGLEARMDAFDNRLDAFELRLDSLSQEIDRRFEQVDARFEQVEARFVEVDRRFAEVYRRFDAVDERIALLAADVDRGLTRLESRMDSLESKLDARFGWQTVTFAVLGLLVLFADPIRAALGL